MPVSCNGADTNATQQQCEEIRIIIIGASGSGKSTAANILIGEDMFEVSSINNPVSPATCQLKQTKLQHPRVKVSIITNSPHKKINRQSHSLTHLIE